MQVNVPSAILQTVIFAIALLVIVLLTRKRRTPLGLDLAATGELKGFAILAIIFAHIGYFLSTDHNFLFPLSVLAGVGVTMFLILSGYGLSISQMTRPLSIKQFYQRRLKRLFILLWIILTLWFILDAIIIHLYFPPLYIFQSYLGLFPSSNLYMDVDSPLWYFTLILFYYLLFPLVFWKKKPLLAAPLLLLTTFIITQFNFPYFWKTNDLYRVHLWGFPLGVFLATSLPWTKQLFQRIAGFYLDHRWILIVTMLGLAILVGYISVYNSGVGESLAKEQLMGLIVSFSLIGIFILKRFQVGLFATFGKYSYEIYLVHWPIVYYYDFLYKFLPAVVATLFYLAIFLGLGVGLQTLDKYLDKKIRLR